jgi:hypothetical protein
VQADITDRTQAAAGTFLMGTTEFVVGGLLFGDGRWHPTLLLKPKRDRGICAPAVDPFVAIEDDE